MNVIMKDGLYLVKAYDMGIRERDGNGVLQSVPTALYSSNKRDAKETKNRSLARQLGGEVVSIPTVRRAVKHDEAGGT